MRLPPSMRSAANGLAGDNACGLPPRNVSEGGADGHADTGDVALAEHVAGHDFAGGENVGRRTTVAQDNLCAFVDGHAEVSKRDAGAQWVGEERRRIDGPRPVRLGRLRSE